MVVRNNNKDWSKKFTWEAPASDSPHGSPARPGWAWAKSPGRSRAPPDRGTSGPPPYLGIIPWSFSLLPPAELNSKNEIEAPLFARFALWSLLPAREGGCGRSSQTLWIKTIPNAVVLITGDVSSKTPCVLLPFLPQCKTLVVRNNNKDWSKKFTWEAPASDSPHGSPARPGWAWAKSPGWSRAPPDRGTSGPPPYLEIIPWSFSLLPPAELNSKNEIEAPLFARFALWSLLPSTSPWPTLGVKLKSLKRDTERLLKLSSVGLCCAIKSQLKLSEYS